MTSTSTFAAQTCIVGVVVMSEYNMASYFPEARNSNGSNADICPDVAGPSSSDSDDFFLGFQIALDPVLLPSSPHD